MPYRVSHIRYFKYLHFACCYINEHITTCIFNTSVVINFMGTAAAWVITYQCHLIKSLDADYYQLGDKNTAYWFHTWHLITLLSFIDQNQLSCYIASRKQIFPQMQCMAHLSASSSVLFALYKRSIKIRCDRIAVICCSSQKNRGSMI